MRRPQSAQVQKIMINRPKDELVDARQQINQLNDENRKIKTQNMQLKRQLMKYEHIDENLINSQQLLGRSSEQPSIVPSLKYKIRVQQNEIDVLKQQLQLQQKQMRMTSIQELEYQIQQYQEESVKLKQMLEDALTINSDKKKTQYIGYLSKIQELKLEIKQYNSVCENQARDINKLQQKIKSQQDQLLSERKKYETQSNDQQRIQNQSQISKSVVIVDKRKEEFQEVQSNQYSYQLQLQEKDRTIAELTENLNSINKNHLGKINSQLQFIEQQNAQLGVKQSIINNMEQEIQKLHLQIKDINTKHQLMLKSNITIDQSTQMPQYQDYNVDAIKNILRFRLRRSMIRQKDIADFLITSEEPRFNQIQSSFQEYQIIYFRFPFKLTNEQSYNITSYLLSTEESTINNRTLEKNLPIQVLKSRILHLLPNYDIVNPEQEGLFFEFISKRIFTQLNSIAEVIKQIKKQEKSHLPVSLCLPNQFSDASKVILDNPLSNKETDYILQLSFEMTNDPLHINIQKVIDLFQLKPSSDLLTAKKLLTQTQSSILFSYNKEAVVKPKRTRLSILSNTSPKSNDNNPHHLKLNQAFSVISIRPKQKKAKVLSLKKIYQLQLGIVHISRIIVHHYTQTESVHAIDSVCQTPRQQLKISKFEEVQFMHKTEKINFQTQCQLDNEIIVQKQVVQEIVEEDVHFQLADQYLSSFLDYDQEVNKIVSDYLQSFI